MWSKLFMSGIKTLHEGQRNYKCKSCEKAFAESRNHIKKIHKGQRNYKYESCEKSFAEPRNHIKIVHKGQSNYKCDSYTKSFTKSRNATFVANPSLNHEFWRKTSNHCKKGKGISNGIYIFSDER